jgi:hypothetical protein
MTAEKDRVEGCDSGHDEVAKYLMTTLTHAFGQKRPTFAVSLRVVDPGVVRLGDEVEVV